MAKHRKRRRLNRNSFGGRPRGSLRSRAPRKINIPPTPEFMEKRLALAAGGDHRLCGYPLGVMVARGYITRADHDAGLDYAGLYRRKNGATAPTVTMLEGGGGKSDGLPGEHRRFLKGLAHGPEYRRAKRALLQCGREVAEAVERVAVFEDMGAALNDGQCEPVRRGLARLKRHFRRGW